MNLDIKGRNKARTGHFIKHWGVPEDIIIKPYINNNELAYLIYPPKDNRQTWRCVTNGMSEYTQDTGQQLIRTEVYCCMNNMSNWIVSLLNAITLYPFNNNTYIADFDTIPVGKPIDQMNSRFSNLLLAPGMYEDNEKVSVISGITNENIYLHLIVPIYETECKYAINNGGKELWSCLLHSNCSLCLDACRQSIV